MPKPQPSTSVKSPKQFAAHTESGFGPSERQSMEDLLPRSLPFKGPPAMTSKPFHHLDFWNRPALHKNDTDPSISLAILTSPAKGFMAVTEFEHSMRKFVMAWTAQNLLDPVIYTGNFDLLLTKPISERRNMSIGEAYKFYAGHGSWQWEASSEDDPELFLQHDGPVIYSAHTTIINGHMGNKGQPTRTTLDNAIALAASVCQYKRKAFVKAREDSEYPNGFGPSPLRKVYTPESMANEEVQDSAHLLAEQRESEMVLAQYVHDIVNPISTWTDSDSEMEDSDDDAVFSPPCESTSCRNEQLEHGPSSDSTPTISGQTSGDVSDTDEDQEMSSSPPSALLSALEKCASIQQDTFQCHEP